MAITTCFSFRKGFAKVPEEKKVEVKDAIKQALGISSNMAWHNRYNGLIEPRVTEAQKIEEIFLKYDITEIWGE